MRVSTRSLYQSIQERILQLSSDLKNINEKISTGKNINRPSDDPIALIDSIGLKTSLSQIEQYGRNAKVGGSWLNLSEASISQALELLGRAQEIATQMANDTQGAETRMSTAKEVGHLLDQAIALGNTQLGGAYLFAGYQTHTAPFSKITLGGIETAQYQGDSNDFQIQIGKNEMLAVGKNGQTVFMDSNLFDTLGTLKKALEDNDVVTIQQQLTNLKSAENYLNSQIADVGAKANRLDGNETILNNLSLHLTERLSEVEDADFAKVVTELRGKELAYQAALMSSVRITEINILNYLG